METTHEADYNEVVSVVLGKYHQIEGYGSDEEFPKIILTDSIMESVSNMRADMVEKMNRNVIAKCSGYTLLLNDNTGVILIDKSFFDDSIKKNFMWVEVLIHEITHYRDFKNNLGIYGHDTYDSMLYCLPFWYWTEFHARYKGTIHMLDWVNRLPDEEKQKYTANMAKELCSEIEFITSDAGKEMRRYRFMHILGDIAAYSEKGYSIQSGEIDQIFPDYLDYIEFLKSRDKTVDAEHLTVLDFNLKQHIC